VGFHQSLLGGAGMDDSPYTDGSPLVLSVRIRPSPQRLIKTYRNEKRIY